MKGVGKKGEVSFHPVCRMLPPADEWEEEELV